MEYRIIEDTTLPQQLTFKEGAATYGVCVLAFRAFPNSSLV